MGIGLSSSNEARTCCRVNWSALRPAIRAAGSTPGVAKKIRKTRTEIENRTKNIAAILFKINEVTNHLARES